MPTPESDHDFWTLAASCDIVCPQQRPSDHQRLTSDEGSKPAPNKERRPRRGRTRRALGSSKTESSSDKPSEDRPQKRRKNRPIPEDVVRADSLADGHDRNVDPRETGAEIYSDHGLDIEHINEDAIKVLRRLNRYGFQSYLVGGCVRDLLCGQHPKDFDVATSATPREIKRLFRNSRLIGRRFRLAHIHFGDHVLEVSTFRRLAPKTDDDDPLIRRDNVFGTAPEDAQRRDFTINALFYDVLDDVVIDYVGGMKDVKRRCIEIIGDPEVRLREDPVRMLRAAKFAGRLDFDLAADLYDAITKVREDLTKSAPPRLFEELQRLLSRGGALGAFEVLYDTRLLEVFLPEISEHLDRDSWIAGVEPTGEQRFWNTLDALDRAARDGQELSNVVKLGALFCHLFDEILLHEGPLPTAVPQVQYDLGVVAERTLADLSLKLQMPRRDLYRLRQVIVAMRRFISRRPSKRKPSPNQFVRKEYFPESLQLAKIFCAGLGHTPAELHKWQERYERVTGKKL